MATASVCKGYFSEATKQVLHADVAGTALLNQRCEACGSQVVAENKLGEWMPKTHLMPVRRILRAGAKKS